MYNTVSWILWRNLASLLSNLVMRKANIMQYSVSVVSD